MPIKKVEFLIVHCSATPAGRDDDAADIDRMHRVRGFRSIGYHYVIKLDGTVEKGRPDDTPGAHAEGFNSRSLGICYIGGVSANDIKLAVDTRTPAQTEALRVLLLKLSKQHPTAAICGHRDMPRVAKACPSFDVKSWWATVTQ